MTLDPTSMRADALQNYKRLVKVASTVFSTQGALVPLDVIAKRAGVGIGTLYRHFPSRKDLLQAVYADKLADLVAKAQSLLGTAAPEKALASWLEVTAEYAEKDDGFGNLLAHTIKDKGSPLMAAGEELLTRAQKAGALRKDVTISDLLQLLSSIVAEDTSPQKTNKLLSIIMAGLKPTK